MSRSPLVFALALAASSTLAGCSSCAGDDAAKTAAGPDADKGKKKKKKADRPPVQKRATEWEALLPHVLAVQLKDKVYLWADGAINPVAQPADAVSWTPEGWAFAADGGTRVLAPGGASYWRPGAPAAGQKVAELFATTTTPPEGFKLEADLDRGNRYKVQLVGPQDRLVRMGMHDAPPTATAWMQGTLPTNRKVAKLDSTAPWKKDPTSGHLLHDAPDGATRAGEAAADGDTWMKEASTMLGAGAKKELALALDLDGDPEKEGLLCISGGVPMQSCFVVDAVAGQRRYHGTSLPWKGGDAATAPFGITKDGASYILYVGTAARGGASSPPLAHVVRWDGGAFSMDVIRAK
jgi:hypothetical protein